LQLPDVSDAGWLFIGRIIALRQFLFFTTLLLAAVSANAAQPADGGVWIPGGWRSGLPVTSPDFGNLRTLRFVTTRGYPPFNYYDDNERLSGFNVDIANAICDELALRCDIRVIEWEEIVSTLENGEADAGIASMKISQDNLERLEFSQRYYQTPARFVARTDSELAGLAPDVLAGKRVAVVEKTAHEAFLRDFFSSVEPVLFVDAAHARSALKRGKVDLYFGDAISLSLWLNGSRSANCCAFLGPAYSAARYFGEGVGVAVKQGNRHILSILNYGLQRVHMSGAYEELFLRYFPISIY
jgi:polar amino acid transport system substrate-binding protein